jgi:sugar phosphate isomerase/epimerase
MKYGLALDCMFRSCEAFRDGSNLEQVFERLRSLGIDTVEINAYRRFEHDEDIYERKLRLLGSMPDITVTLHRGNHDLSSLDEDRRLEQVRVVCSVIEYNARFLQPHLIVLHPGSPTASQEEVDRRYDQLRKSTLPILDCCEKHGVRLVYENMRLQYPTPGNGELTQLLGEEELSRVLAEEPMRAFPRVGSYISRLLAFVRSFDTDRIGLCIDTGHANISEGKALPDKIKECGPTLHHVHTSDNFGINDNHMQPGAANVDWRAFYAALEAIDYQGIVMLEITPKFQDPADLTTEGILQLVEEDHKHFVARGDCLPQLDPETVRLQDIWRHEGPK